MPSGRFMEDGKKPSDDDDDATDDDAADEKGSDDDAGVLTTSATLPVLYKLVRGIQKGCWDNCLAKMAQAGKGKNVDLTLATSARLLQRLEQIGQLHAAEFKAPPPAQGAPNTVSVTPVGVSSSEAPTVDVIVTQIDFQNQGEYNAALVAHEAAVDRFHVNAAKEFISMRVAFVLAKLDPEDTAGAIKRLRKVPVLQENKRKLFVEEEGLMQPAPWEQIKRRRQLPTTFIKSSLDDDDLKPLSNLWSEFRSVDSDNKSSDIMLCTFLPSPENCPVNPGMSIAHGRFRKMSPHLATIRIGEIRHPVEDFVKRAKKGSLGTNSRPLLFGTQAKLVVPRRAMLHLAGGHTAVNEWPVPETPLNNMIKVTPDLHTKLFGVDAPYNVEDVEDQPDGSEFLQALGDKLIPYPLELPAPLFQELIEQLGVAILIALRPASGNSMKAVLFKNIRGVAICPTAEQRDLIMTELITAVRQFKLATPTGTPPKKPQALLDWETAQGRNKKAGVPNVVVPSAAVAAAAGTLPAQDGALPFAGAAPPKAGLNPIGAPKAGSFGSPGLVGAPHPFASPPAPTHASKNPFSSPGSSSDAGPAAAGIAAFGSSIM